MITNLSSYHHQKTLLTYFEQNNNNVLNFKFCEIEENDGRNILMTSQQKRSTEIEQTNESHQIESMYRDHCSCSALSFEYGYQNMNFPWHHKNCNGETFVQKRRLVRMHKLSSHFNFKRCIKNSGTNLSSQIRDYFDIILLLITNLGLDLKEAPLTHQ